MRDAIERISALAAMAGARYRKRMRFSLFIALLLAALLWRTTWPSLRPGLIILLAGYVGAACLFFYRSARLSKETELLRSQPGDRGALLQWFDKEEAFGKWSAAAEASLRAVGFMVLGYGFWLATRSGLVALLLGIGYPAITYFGVERRNNQRVRQALGTEREAMAGFLGADEHTGL